MSLKIYQKDFNCLLLNMKVVFILLVLTICLFKANQIDASSSPDKSSKLGFKKSFAQSAKSKGKKSTFKKGKAISQRKTAPKNTFKQGSKSKAVGKTKSGNARKSQSKTFPKKNNGFSKGKSKNVLPKGKTPRKNAKKSITRTSKQIKTEENTCTISKNQLEFQSVAREIVRKYKVANSNFGKMKKKLDKVEVTKLKKTLYNDTFKMYVLEIGIQSSLYNTFECPWWRSSIIELQWFTPKQ